MQSQEQVSECFNGRDIVRCVRNNEQHSSWKILWEYRTTPLEYMRRFFILSAIFGFLLSLMVGLPVFTASVSLSRGLFTTVLVYIGAVLLLSSIGYLIGKINEGRFRGICVVTALGVIVEVKEDHYDMISFADIDDLTIDSVYEKDGREIYGLRIVNGQMERFFTMPPLLSMRLPYIIAVYRDFKRNNRGIPKETSPEEMGTPLSDSSQEYEGYRGI